MGGRGDGLDRADFWEVLSQAHANSEHSSAARDAASLVCELHLHRLAPCKEFILTTADFAEFLKSDRLLRPCSLIVTNVY
jgi:hypothetical protein